MILTGFCYAAGIFPGGWLFALLVVPDALKFKCFMFSVLNVVESADVSLCHFFTFMLTKSFFFFLSQNQLGTCSKLFHLFSLFLVALDSLT